MQIFVSYSRSDKAFVEQLVPLVGKVYSNVWYDEHIYGGDDWWEMILSQIADCDLFIYLISNHSLESPYCQAELAEALRLQKQILPVIVYRLKPPYPGNIKHELADFLKRTQYVDMSKGFREPAILANLYGAIAQRATKIPSEAQTPLQSEPTPRPPVPDKKDDPKIPVWLVVAFILILSGISVLSLWQYFLSQPESVVDSRSTETPTLVSLVARFTVDSSTGIAPLTVNFTNTSTGDVDGYRWDFNGDGLVDNTEENPSFTYNSGGNYTVILTVNGVNG
ncbi:MAG: TIR domain-containing protein, partial [Bacteroidota bacterium]